MTRDDGAEESSTSADDLAPLTILRRAGRFAVAMMLVRSCNIAIGLADRKHDSWTRELLSAAAMGVGAFALLALFNAIYGWLRRDDDQRNGGPPIQQTSE